MACVLGPEGLYIPKGLWPQSRGILECNTCHGYFVFCRVHPAINLQQSGSSVLQHHHPADLKKHSCGNAYCCCVRNFLSCYVAAQCYAGLPCKAAVAVAVPQWRAQDTMTAAALILSPVGLLAGWRFVGFDLRHSPLQHCLPVPCHCGKASNAAIVNRIA